MTVTTRKFQNSEFRFQIGNQSEIYLKSEVRNLKSRKGRA